MRPIEAVWNVSNLISYQHFGEDNDRVGAAQLF